MELTQEVIKKIAKLSRIKLDNEELPYYQREIEGILKWLDQLNEVDVSNVKPMISSIDTETYLREDKVDISDIKEKILYNAPKEKYGYFAVPKVIE